MFTFLASLLLTLCLLVVLVEGDSGEFVTPWTPYRGPTRKVPHFSFWDLFGLPDGEVAGGHYIRRCITCDMPRLFKAFHRK